ncbi:DUF485 domain-containing protein [Streptomyces apocyni]|uniref:DUF485 domain-containing protein n=1 Tax=Streptomyces apocyni TaxID=2654677 RepID=UPI0012EA842B|nr:DUF485 domain-containing protein [Streptomyces apocyni]
MDKHDRRDAGQIQLGDLSDIGDPWYDALDSGWGERDSTGALVPAPPPAHPAPQDRSVSVADIYLEVQHSAAFQEVRRRYRRFVVPLVALFLCWYVAYVVAATAAPGLMARPVAGAVNVALLAGLGQFVTTFLLTWVYARHARLRRDEAALDLRWVVFDRKRVRDQAAGTAGTMGTTGADR